MAAVKLFFLLVFSGGMHGILCFTNSDDGKVLSIGTFISLGFADFFILNSDLVVCILPHFPNTMIWMFENISLIQSLLLFTFTKDHEITRHFLFSLNHVDSFQCSPVFSAL